MFSVGGCRVEERFDGSLNLFENAIDSLQHGLTHLADFNDGLSLSDAKQAVMNLVNSIDLLVLEKLRRIDADAIYASENEDAFGIGYRPTIHVDQAYQKIRKHLNKPIEGPEWDAYQILKILRNSANHFYFSFGEERKENVTFLLHYIARFIEDDLNEKLDNYLTKEDYTFYLELIDGTEYGDVLYERKEAARMEYIRQSISWLEYRSIKDGGGPIVAEWPCNECGEDGVSLDERLAPVGECAFCGHHHETAFCERCGCMIDLAWDGIDLSGFGNYWCDNCYDNYINRD